MEKDFPNQAFHQYYNQFKEFHTSRSISATETGVIDRVMSKSFISEMGN